MVKFKIPRGKQQCKNCCFYVVFGIATDDIGSGNCHRNSPRVMGSKNEDQLAKWPIVDFDDWCGEWKDG